MRKKLFATAIMGVGCVMSGFAQISLTGKVVDAETNEPIQGAYIRLKETNIGCTTNDKGEFSLVGVPDGKYAMRISRMDYASETLSVNKSMQNILVRLNESTVNLDQVVVTGTGTHHKLKDSPVPVQVISQKEIQQVNASGVEDVLLKLVPSISFQSTSMSNNIYMNGLSGKYVLVLINGRKVAGDVSGNVDFSRVNIANVKRIEILNGAASALYGSDAIAGVINIIMDESRDELNIMSNSRISSHGRFTQSVNADVNVNRFSSHTSYQRQQSDGWKLSDYEESNGELVETDKQPIYHWFSNDINQSFSYRFTDRFSVNVFGTYSTYERS